MNKSVRNKIYRKALKVYIKEAIELNSSSFTGLCWTLYQVHIKHPKWFTEGDGMELDGGIITLFPELYAQKPINSVMHYPFWWSCEDTAVRVQALTNAIKETDEN